VVPPGVRLDGVEQARGSPFPMPTTTFEPSPM
jgi:hypothetical protein